MSELDGIGLSYMYSYFVVKTSTSLQNAELAEAPIRFDSPGFQWISVGSGIEHAEGGGTEKGS